MRGWGALAALLAVLVSKGQAMDIQEFKLENGLRVLVVPDHRVPVVTHSVWYKVGSMDEVQGKTGLAHMTEHLMFKGTARHPAGEMDQIVQRKGGVQNAFTSTDYTAYYQKVPVQELPTMMDLESDRMENLALNDKVFQPERKVVAEERKLTTDSNPSDRFYEEVMRRHYAHHGYGHPIIGWAKDIQGYTFEDAMSWYRKHYAPNNATMILVGDVEAKDIRPLVEKYYAGVSRSEVAPRVQKAEPSRSGPLEYVKVDAQVKVPAWTLMYRAPSHFAGIAGGIVKPEEATAIGILAEIIGGSDTSRLYQQLVVKQGLADQASCHYDSVRAGETTIDFSVQPKQDVTADRLAPAVDAVITDVLKNGVTKAELEKAKVTVMADEIYARDDSFITMYRLGMWVNAGGDPKNFDDWQAELKKLTVDDVNRVAKAYLNNQTSTLAVLAGTPEQLGKLKPTLDN